MVRTRFAPSPTGYLHIGGVRTALFCWLYARRHGGQFLLRIDDTDQQRNVESALAPILHGFRWLIANDGLQVVTPDNYYFGGMIRSIKVARMAQAFGKIALELELRELLHRPRIGRNRTARWPGFTRGPKRLPQTR